MSLKATNKATTKQKLTLKKLQYYGSGRYAINNLSLQEASELIDELFEAERLIERADQEDKGDLFDLLDPFNDINK